MKLKFTFFIFLMCLLVILNQSYNNGSQIGAFQNCATCHLGATSTTMIDSVVFVNPNTGVRLLSSYQPDSTYNVFIYAHNMGGLLQFGFQMEKTKGTWLNPIGTSQIVMTNIWTHSSKMITTGGALFTSCSWKAPAAGSGVASFDLYVNAVNNNGQNTGDAPSALFTKAFSEATVTASVSIARTNGPAPICLSDSAVYVATPTNGGTAPTYQWYLNGNQVGTNSSTYVAKSPLLPTNSVYCIMTSNLPGVTGSPATSNTLALITTNTFINANLINSNRTSGCAGDSFIFNSTPTPGSIVARYLWYINDTFYRATLNSNLALVGILNNQDSIYCKVKINNNCRNRDTSLKSNTIKVTVNPSPNVTGFSNQTVCANQMTTATSWVVTPATGTMSWTNSNPSIGLAASGSGNIPSFMALNNTGAPKLAQITINSNDAGCSGIQRTFTYRVLPIPIAHPIQNQSYCANSNVMINVNPAFGSSISWVANDTTCGIKKSDTTNPIQFFAVNNTDTIKEIEVLIHSSNALCTGLDTILKFDVKPTPRLTSKPVNLTFCPNDTVKINSFLSNIPGSIIYWANSNINIGLGAIGSNPIPTFVAKNTTTTPITATIKVLDSFNICKSTDSFTITVNAAVKPSVTIKAIDTLVCPNGSTQVIAKPVNAGTSQTYAWFINGVLYSGQNKDTLNISSITSKTNVRCVMTSSGGCTSSKNDTSNYAIIDTSSKSLPNIQISSAKDSICIGEALTIYSTATGLGSSPTYQWYRNGVKVAGATGTIFPYNSWADGDVVYCELNANSQCSPLPIQSNIKTISVFPIVATSLQIFKSSNSICSGDTVAFTSQYSGQGLFAKFQWTVNGIPVGINPDILNYPIDNNMEVVALKMTSSNYCASPKDTTVSTKIDSVGFGPFVSLAKPLYKSFCEGDSVEVGALTASTTAQYKWSNGKTTKSFFSKITSDYYLTVTDAGYQCPRKLGPVSTYMILKPSKPTLQIVDSTIYSTYNNNYQWQLNQKDIAGATFQHYVFNQPGLYRVKVVNSVGCVNYSDEINPYANTVGISQSSVNKVMIYPNPTSSQVEITLNTKGDKSLVIFDLLGKEVFTNKWKGYKTILNLNSLNTGHYIIKISDENQTWTEKLEIAK